VNLANFHFSGDYEFIVEDLGFIWVADSFFAKGGCYTNMAISLMHNTSIRHSSPILLSHRILSPTPSVYKKFLRISLPLYQSGFSTETRPIGYIET
jgi:hypothetical protein